MGKVNHKKDANNNPLLIFAISFIFMAGGGVGLYAFTINGITASIAMPFTISAFLAGVGLLLFGFGVYRTFLISKYNKLKNDVSAHVAQAKYIGKKVSGGSSSDVNGNIVSEHIFYTLEYEYTDERGMLRKTKSIMSYTREQAEYLEEKGKFMVKCKGSISYILEEGLPKTDESYNI